MIIIMIFETIFIQILKFTLIFMMGTILGWILELVWRRFFGLAKRWINPGFLNGPWLPLYGFGSVALYFICSIPIPFYYKIIIFFVGLTILEYIAGIIFVKFYNIRLWDYSKNWANLKGIICPFYSFLWTILGVFFYFVIFPQFQGKVITLLKHLELSFFIGLFVGVFVLDLFHSFNLANQIRSILKESRERWNVDFETLKLEIRDRFIAIKSDRLKPRFLLPFHGETVNSFRKIINIHKLSIKSKK